MSRHEHDTDTSLVRAEEELRVGTSEEVVGALHARKRVETENVAAHVPRSREDGDFERAPASEDDSGEIETLPDGSVSIPLLEERLVVRREVFVRERVILRKHTITEQHELETELRRERLELDVDDDVADRVAVGDGWRREG